MGVSAQIEWIIDCFNYCINFKKFHLTKIKLKGISVNLICGLRNLILELDIRGDLDGF